MSKDARSEDSVDAAVRPHCVQLTREWIFVGKPKTGRPAKRILKAGSVGTWHRWGCFTWTHDRGWTPHLSWDELLAFPEAWVALGYDTNSDGDCAHCACRPNVPDDPRR